MNEVSSQAVLLLLDAVEQNGLDPITLWRGLPVTPELIRTRHARIDWETWVAMMERVEQHAPRPMEEMFVPGGGARVGHTFVTIANALLSMRDVYALLARWGLRRSFMVARARFSSDENRGRFVVSIDPTRAGSLPMLRFMTGLLRHMPQLHGHGSIDVRMLDGATGHHAEYELELPPERPLLSRARRLVRSLGGVAWTIDELESQASELATKNAELDQQLAETRQHEQWLDVALAASDIGLWRWDPSVRRVKISPALATFLELPGETEIDTATWGKRVHPDDRNELIQQMAQALEDRTPYEVEYRVVRANGDVRWCHVKGRVETEPDGRVYAYGSSVDITDKKLMEARLRLADRLIAAGTLAAGVAHEINNPLTYVIGSVDLIQRRLAQHPAAREVTQDLVAQILDGCERIRLVVADVKSFARHDDDAVGPVDLRAVCSAALRIVSSDIRHRANIELDLAADTPLVLANESRLGQVTINLLVNASQAMPADRVSAQNRIVVRTRRLASGEAVLEVEDNGVGIPAAVLPRLFDPFFTTKPIGVGTGLGLSVCNGIVTSLGGRIDVDTTVGRGSRFTVTLKPAPEDQVSAEPAPVMPASEGSGRVLVIDDEPLVRNVVARTLAAVGFAVDEAESGRDGLSRATGPTHYDAILCDLLMPDLDGVALHSELVQHRPELANRIVFISGGAVTPRTQAFLERPGIVVLHKPFAFERLVEAIERAAHGTSTSLPLT